jgi:poly-gamma-glutamate capsule biosynthesis protein CapA/YwtB (metallophosphatase superfamily)
VYLLAPVSPSRQSKRATLKLTAAAIILIAALLSRPLTIQAEEIVINAVGDVMLAGRWAASISRSGYDSPFRGVSAELRAGDITIANLESPIARGGSEFTDKRFRFRAEPEVAGALKRSGINLVTLANNHTMDFGEVALDETMLHLESAGIAWIGAGNNLAEARKMALYTIKGKKVAFLGYSLTKPLEFFAGRNRPGTAPGLEKFFVEDIRRARLEADYVIVSFHWGTEGSSEIQPYQRTVAHKAIDAGADVIIGHHPHVLRGIERYKTGIVFYSLGNFIFASKGRSAEAGVMVRIRFSEGKREAELLPLDILHRRVGFQPQPASGRQAAGIIERLNSLSNHLNTQIQGRDGRYEISF